MTICTAGREPTLGTLVDDSVRLTAIGQIVEHTWLELPTRFRRLELGAHIVMPEHVHGVIATPDRVSLPRVIQAFKSLSANRAAAQRPLAAGRLWQRGFMERVIRSWEELDRIDLYIRQNPMRRAARLGRHVGEEHC